MSSDYENSRKPSFDTSDISDAGDKSPVRDSNPAHVLHDDHTGNQHHGDDYDGEDVDVDGHDYDHDHNQVHDDGGRVNGDDDDYSAIEANERPRSAASNNYDSDMDSNRPHSQRSRSPDDRKINFDDDEEGEFWDQNDDDMVPNSRHAQPASLRVMDLELGRAPDLESTDGEIHTLHIPDFLHVEEEDFRPETYVPSTFNVAATSLCWRRDPLDGESIQSNARIIKWSDGSLTLQLASNPREHYQITSKRLARPHIKKSSDNTQMDAHVYLGTPSDSAGVIRISGHVTSQLDILPTNVETDDAVEQLRHSLAQAAKHANINPDGSVNIIEITEDPELAKKRAEAAEREKLRAERKRIAAQERELDRVPRKVGGYARTGGAGLTVAGLEDDSSLSTTRAKKPQKRRANRHGDIYSDDEEQGRRGRTREDEYDEGDGFLVGSDEELETYSDGGEDSEGLDQEESDYGHHRKSRQKERERRSRRPSTNQRLQPDTSPAERQRKRQRTPAVEEKKSPVKRESPYVRQKKRYTIGDDDDDE